MAKFATKPKPASKPVQLRGTCPQARNIPLLNKYRITEAIEAVEKRYQTFSLDVAVTDEGTEAESTTITIIASNPIVIDPTKAS